MEVLASLQLLLVDEIYLNGTYQSNRLPCSSTWTFVNDGVIDIFQGYQLNVLNVMYSSNLSHEVLKPTDLLKSTNETIAM